PSHCALPPFPTRRSSDLDAKGAVVRLSATSSVEIVEGPAAGGRTRMTLRDRLPQRSFDAVVIGSGPNGLAAAIAIAQRKRSVLVDRKSTRLNSSHVSISY